MTRAGLSRWEARRMAKEFDLLELPWIPIGTLDEAREREDRRPFGIYGSINIAASFPAEEIFFNIPEYDGAPDLPIRRGSTNTGLWARIDPPRKEDQKKLEERLLENPDPPSALREGGLYFSSAEHDRYIFISSKVMPRSGLRGLWEALTNPLKTRGKLRDGEDLFIIAARQYYHLGEIRMGCGLLDPGEYLKAIAIRRNPKEYLDNKV